MGSNDKSLSVSSQAAGREAAWIIADQFTNKWIDRCGTLEGCEKRFSSTDTRALDWLIEQGERGPETSYCAWCGQFVQRRIAARTQEDTQPVTATTKDISDE